MTEQTIEHTEIEGTGFSLIPIIPFEQWIQSKYGSWDKFNTLSHKDKGKIFLRWKWGFEDERANEELESTERQVLYLFKDNDLIDLSEPWRFHIQHKRQFDRICYETKIRIGIIQKKNPIVDKIVKKFDASEY